MEAPATGAPPRHPGKARPSSPGSQETCPRPAMTTLEERAASMPTLVPIRLAAACALALLLLLSTAAIASAKKFKADLRVVAKGKVLAEKTLKTGTSSIP